MSFVLDALNQVEKRRKEERPVSMDDFLTAESHNPISARRIQPLIPIAATALTMVIGFSVWQFVSVDKAPASNEVARSYRTAPPEDKADIRITPIVQTELTPEQKALPSGTTHKVLTQPNQENAVSRPDFKATGYLFLGEHSSSNKVFVNGRGYRKGSSINGYQIIKIESNSFTVKRNNQEFQLPY